MTIKKVGGYIFQQELTRAKNSNRLARTMLRRIVDENPGAASMAMMIAKTANALGENLEALQEIEQISQSARPTES
jgi:hypothetical protein